MSTRSKLLAFALVLAPLAASADPLPPPVQGMDCLLGTWKGAGTIAMGKDKAKVEATWTCQRTPGNFGVSCHFRVTGIPGVAAYEETDLMGYEPNTNTYHWFSVTNAGETHDHVAAAKDSPKIQFVYTGTQEGKPLKEVIDLDFGADKKSLTGRAETFVGGKSSSVLELALRK